jgi:branched-chain amino acid transport system ATP-binding protein
MLTVENLQAAYGKSRILQGVSLSVGEGEVVGVLGRNGVGKTTLLMTILDLVKPLAGTIRFRGTDITRLETHAIARRGIGYVPQGRRIFARLTVLENLRAGHVDGDFQGKLREVFERFPRLAERRAQLGRTLSGGEQQMLAIARAEMSEPRLMLMDEPTEGLMPSMVEEMRRAIKAMNERGRAILLVEQNIETALRTCHRIYFMEKGLIAHETATAGLTQEVVHRYLGV